MMKYDHYRRLADARDNALEAKVKALDAYRAALAALDLLEEVISEVEKEGTEL